MTYRKKLIKVALPLGETNRGSARERSIRHERPLTLRFCWPAGRS